MQFDGEDVELEQQAFVYQISITHMHATKHFNAVNARDCLMIYRLDNNSFIVSVWCVHMEGNSEFFVFLLSSGTAYA